MEIYLVGGAVRNRLLQRPIKDRDWVVVGATPEQLLAQGFRRVGKSFPVFIHPQSGEEYTLACRVRGDLSTAGTEVTIEDDLCARDLSINALAEAPDGRLIDPVGGLQDLEARVLRHVRPDAFRRDPLRVLRVARLAAELGFRIAPETYRAMRGWRVREGLSCLPGERVWAELERALACEAPTRFFQELREAGVLGDVLPEVERLFGVPQPARWHPEIDTGRHTLMVLEQARALSPRTDVRFAALTHDLGKGTTPSDLLPSHRGHEERGVRLVERLGERLRVPRAVLELARLTARWHAYPHRAAQLRPGTVLDVLERTDAFRRPERFEHFLLACEADYRGRTGFEARPYPQGAYFRRALAAASAVETAELAGRTPGAATAAAIRRARLAALAGLSPPAANQPA
jgi:tRNA nucleotidyltransferase (CCA-adding enzyme)